jgi:hypothetical protein
MRAVKWKGKPPQRIKKHAPAHTFHAFNVLEDLPSGFYWGEVGELNKVGYSSRKRDACECIALAGGADGTDIVVCPSPSSNHRRIANPSGNLIHEAAGGCGRGEIASSIPGNRADSAMGSFVIAVIEQEFGSSLPAFPLLQTIRRTEVLWGNHFEPGALGVRVSTLSEKKAMSVFHQGLGRENGISGSFHTDHGTHCQVSAVHDGSAQLDTTI